ncbi:uncharacterized protein LOC101860651 [Aplysia californica]|uniref:Uncharacterized protein LOC101860651 n=1 Tax=Aplysia californica TaxID=6500 RepID=A0ABM0ZYZ8_APLCA|nr:uncharacterized protein LOC101860651 [Aplysia californica]
MATTPHFSLYTSLLLALLSTQATKSLNTGWLPPPFVCDSSHRPAPSSIPAPPLPTLANQYSMRVEANIAQKSMTVEVEEHYDAPGERAAVTLTSNGNTVVSVFDFKQAKRYDIYQNGSCTTREPTLDYLGFMRRGTDGRPALTTVNQVFRFGRSFQQTYVGTATVRGIPTNHWTSCQEWPALGAKFQLDYYFSHPDYETASGLTQIPVRAVLNGSAHNFGMFHEHLRGNHSFVHIYDFLSYRSGPVFQQDVFQVPPGMVCAGRPDDKPMPALPDRFEMSAEVVVPDSRMPPRQQYLRYDFKNRLVETWTRVTIPGGLKFPGGRGKGSWGSQGSQSWGSQGSQQAGGDVSKEDYRLMSVSKVEDFQSGVVYHIDKINMTCTATRMEAPETGLTMQHGSSLLTLAGITGRPATPADFHYQGRKTVRQMTVDAWAMEHDGITQELYFLPKDLPLRRGGNFTFSQQPPGGSSGSSSSSSSSSPRGRRRFLPYPVLVGMFLKNNTVVGPRDLSRLFREFFSPDAMQWEGGTGRNSHWDTGAARPTRQPGDTSQQQQPSRNPNFPDWSQLTTSDQLAWGARLERMLDRNIGQKLINVFHYHPEVLESANFQVSLCFAPEEQSQVMIVVQASYEENVVTRFAAFSNAMRHAIAETSGLSAVQVSNLIPVPLKSKSVGLDATSVTFTLLGKPPVRGLGDQASLTHAKSKLTSAIQRGISFNVQYSEHSKSFMVDKRMYRLDYDKYKLPTGSFGTQNNSSSNNNKKYDDNNNNVDPATGLYNAGAGKKQPASTKEASGYSGAAVAGVAITMLLVGMAISLGGAFFLYRRRHPGESVIPYRHQT